MQDVDSFKNNIKHKKIDELEKKEGEKNVRKTKRKTTCINQ